MPIYSIEGPDGKTYSIEGPAGATREEVIRAIQMRMQQPAATPEPERFAMPVTPAAPSTQRSFGEAALDIPAAALSGLGSLLQFPGQVAKMLPGLTGVGEALEKPGELVSGAGDYLKSEGLKAREALRSKAISEAEKDGVLSAFGTAIVSTIKDPALITTFLAEQVPLLLGPAGAAKLVQKLGAKSIETAGIGLTGAAAEDAVKEAAKRVSRRAYGAAYGTGSAMQAADVSSDAYEEALRKAREMNIPEEEAQAKALAAGRVAGLGAGTVSLLAQRLPGAKAIEQRLAGVPGTAGKLGSAVGEGISEAIEEGGGQVFKNLGLRQVDPNQSLLEGVGGAAGLGALGGGTLGGILGKRAEEARFEGQREGESDREFAARLQREIQQGIQPPAPPPAPPKIPTDQQLFTLAAQPNGYGLLENLKQRLSGDQTISEEERNAVVDNIRSIQERMTVEEIERKRVTPGAEERFLRPEILTSNQLFDMAAQEGGYGQLESYKQNLLQVKQDAEIKNTIREIEDLQRRMNIEQAQRLIPGAPAPTLEAQAPAAPPAPQLLTTNELFDMASKNDYGGIEQYKQGLKQERQTPEVRKAIEDAEFVQRRMNVERIQPSVSAYFEGKDLNNQDDVDAIAKSLYDELKRKGITPERERQVRTALDVFVNSLPETVEAPPMPDWAVEVPEKRRVPKAPEAKAEEAFRKEIEKKIRDVELESRKVARESNSLFAALKGKLNPKEVFDISPDRRVAPLKKKGAGGVSLDFFVDSGRLDAFLPPDMRHNAAQFNSSASQEYIKDLIRQGVYITFDARMTVEKNNNSVQEMEKLLMEFNTDELNALLQEASDEQRAEEGIAEEVQGAAPEGKGRVAEEGVGAPSAGEEVKPEAAEEKPAEEPAAEKPAEEAPKKVEGPIAALKEEGFEVVTKGTPERYRDTEGTEFFTMQRGPVRVAIKPNEALTVTERGMVLRANEPGNLTISAILVDPEARGEGHARRALESITKAADQFNVTLYVEPVPLGDKPMSKEQLNKFYQSLGFTPLPDSGGKVMLREPEVLPAVEKEAPKAIGKPEGEVIDVEARVVEETLGPKVAALPAPQIATLEKHYGVDKDSPTFLQRIKEDVVLYATKGGKAVAAIIRPIIRNLHAAVLSLAVIFNPTNISTAEAVIFDKQVITETKDIRVAPPESVASKMSPGAQEAYSILYPSIKDQLQRDNKLMLIVDKPRARMFVFTPDGQPLLDKKVLLGKATGDLYKGNNDLPQNRITPAGLFKMGLRDADRSIGEARTAGEYDFKKVFVLDKAIEGEYSVTLFHSVWLKESDAALRAKALKSESETDSRYSFGCINVDKQTYERLITDHLNQMDGASLFIVPDNVAATAEFLTGATAQNVSGADGLTRTTFTPAKETVAYEVKRAGRPGELMREVSRTPVKKSLAKVAKGVPEAKFKELERRAKAAPEVKAEEAPKEEAPAVPEISPEIQAKIDMLKKVLQKNLAKFGLKDVDLNLEQGMADEGSFSGQLIRIALDSPDPLGILRHESIHALKEAGFFTDKQWTTLERTADEKWIDQFLKGQQVEYEGQRMSRYDAYMKEYGGNMALIREEAIADAFRSFSKKKPAGLMGALTERMKNFFKAVKSAFNSQGFESAEDIFGKIEEGKLPAPPAKAIPAGERKSLRAPTTEAFKQWFGDSQVVDESGNPLVVYHGMPQEMEGGEFRRSTYGSLGEGIYFTDDPEAASRFATGVRGSANQVRLGQVPPPRMQGMVLPVYLKIDQPFDDNFFVGNKDWQEWAASILRDGRKAEGDSWPLMTRWQIGAPAYTQKTITSLHDKLMEGNATVSDLMFLGNSDSEAPWGKKIVDAIQKHGSFDGIILQNSPKGFDEYVVFKPNQVKSATGNIGTFEPTSPDIRKSLRQQLATWTDKRIDRLINEYGYTDGRTKAYAASINPADFVLSTTGSPKSAERIYEEAGKLDLEELSGETQTPFLYIETSGKNWEIVGHEGRHRMAALSREGVTKVPVVLVMYENGSRKPSMYERKAPVEIDGQEFKDVGTGDWLYAWDLIPLSYKYEKQLKEKHSSGDIRFSLRTPTDNIVDLTQRRAEQLIAEEAEDTNDLNKQAQIRQRREDLRFLTDEASPFFKSIANQAQIAEDVYRMAPMVKTDIGPALNSYDRMWRNYTTGVYGNDSNMYRSSPDSAFTAVSNLREDLKSADKVKSDITAYLKEATEYANGLSDRKTGEKDLKKELLGVLNRPVVRTKFSLRSMPVIDPVIQARVNDTIKPRERMSVIDKVAEAISPKMFSRIRTEMIFQYNYMAGLDRRVAAQIKAAGGPEQLADKKAEVAALFSDQASAIAAAAMGSHTRKGGIPVYKDGVITVDRSGDNEGIIEIFAPLASTGKPETFQHYQFWAAVNRAKKYIQNPGGTRYVEELFTKDDIEYAERLRADYARQGIDFKDIKNRWIKYNNGLVKLMRDTGTISERAAREFMEHADYFPFYRQINEEDMAGPKTFSTIAGTKPPKAAKGSEEALGDFFETIIRNTQSAITLAAKNVAAQRTTSQALSINEVVRLSEKPRVVQTGATTWDVLDSQYADTVSAPDQAAAMSIARARYGANATVDQNPNGQWNIFKAVKIGEVDGATNIKEAIEDANTNHKYRPDVYTYRVFENGQPIYYRAYDIDLINAIKALNTADLPFLGLLSAPANALRTLVTKDPGYMLVNQMRDSLSAYQTSGVKITPIVDSARQFAKSIAKETPEMEALFDGGVIGGYEYAHGARESGAYLEKELRRKAGVRTAAESIGKPFTSLWGALERGTQISDGATRAEVYKRVLAETGNRAEALWQAAEVLNFYRHGRSPVIRVLTAAIPFLNSRIQGLDVLYRTGINPMLDKTATDAQKQRMKTFWIRGMTLMALSSMYWMLTHDDDEYKKQEQETRDNYWLIPSLGIKIAIPFEVGVIFKVLPERILQNAFGTDTGKESMESFKRQLQSTLMFNMIPQAFLPYYEVTTNFSFFTQRPIIGKGMENVSPRFQVGPGTSSLAQLIADKLRIETTNDSSAFTKSLAKQLEISPIKLDHMIKGYTGTIGQYAVDVFDALYNMNADVPKPSKRFEQLPIIKRLAIDPNARGTVTSYYDLKNAVDETVRTSNFLERTMNAEQYGAYLRENIGILANREYVSAMDKTMSELRDAKNLIRYSKMDEDRKRDAILAIEKMENQLTSNIQTVRKKAYD